jgi:hypothetical protein
VQNHSVESGESKRKISFFLIYALVLLAIVLAGFTPSLYLRLGFDVPPIPFYLHIHGAILTGWFVWLVAQAWLVQAGNPGLHRKLGAFAATYGLLVVVGALMATFNAVERDLAQGVTFDTSMAEIAPEVGGELSYLNFIRGVVWGNITGATTFAVLLVAAVLFRGHPDVHKRLVLIATVSIIGPALARIARWEILGGEQGPFIPLALLTLLAAIAIYDMFALRRVHMATVMAVAFAITLRALGSMASRSDFGTDFVRSLG